jgi:D-alanyl-D-alanine carboxypeptidase (penicillin-binding protein 5/6)
MIVVRARRGAHAVSPRRLTAALMCAAALAAGFSATAGAAGPRSAPRVRSAGPPSLSVRAAILVEASTGQRLYGVDPDGQIAIASATKLMTALLTLEHSRLRQVFADPNYYPAAEDSQIGLVPGERMTVHDLLLAMLLPSADDAAEDLAYNLGHGSVARFIGMMNARARQLGLTHTHYSTPIGLDTTGNYSSASDLVKLAEYLRRTQPFFVRAVALRGAVLHSGDRERVVANRNTLVGEVPWINGIKTGHTLDAGYVLVGSGTKDGMTLLSAVLGTSSEASRDANTLGLLRWGFANFRLATPFHAGQSFARLRVSGQPDRHPQVVAARTFTHVVGRADLVTTRVEVPREVKGPLARHAVVGHVLVFAGRHRIGRVDLLLARALPAPSPLHSATRFITRPSTLLSLSVLLGVAMVVVVVRRRLRTRHIGNDGAEPA